MPAPRRPFSAAFVTALVPVVLAGLAGCSGDADADPDADGSASPSASEAETPSASSSVSEAADQDETEETLIPLPKPPKAADTPAARKAWAEFVVDRWGYALTTNEADALSDLSPQGTTCRGCKDLEAELKKRRSEGWSVDFPGAEVTKAEVRPAGAPRTYDAELVVDIPASRSYFDDGTYRNDNKAFENADFTVQMRWNGSRYLLLSYTVG